MNTHQIARIAHETNRAYCASIGDNSQPKWEEAPEWQQTSAIKGVQFHLGNLRQGRKPALSASHDAWLEEKRRDGWTYGQVKNPDKKEHPCFVPYDELPIEQRMKDFLFAGVVESFFLCFEGSAVSA